MDTDKLKFISQLSETLRSLADLIEEAVTLSSTEKIIYKEPKNKNPVVGVKFAKSGLKKISQYGDNDIINYIKATNPIVKNEDKKKNIIKLLESAQQSNEKDEKDEKDESNSIIDEYVNVRNVQELKCESENSTKIKNKVLNILEENGKNEDSE